MATKTVSRSGDTGTSWDAAEAALDRQDGSTALSIFSTLAEKGEWLAYVEVGNLLELAPPGVKRDIDGAMRWYRKAIFESDDPNAHFAMARLYWNGAYIPTDHLKAYQHAKKAVAAPEPYRLAERYRPMAYVMLGSMYLNGLGVSADVEKARAVLRQGAGEGFVWPIFELSKLELKCWHVFESIRLRFRASRIAGQLLANDPNDVRLVGINVKRGKN